MRTKSSLLPAVAVLILWGALMALLGQRGVFATTPERPPIPLLLSVVLPLIDFVGAIGGGVLSGNNPIGLLRGLVTTDIMEQLPLSIIPTFGVPAWILVHLVSLLKVARDEVPELEIEAAT